MRKNDYLKWMAENTKTQWCNDSALRDDYLAAMQYGTIGVTTNPPLSFQALTENSDRFSAKVAEVKKNFAGDERVVEYLRLVVQDISAEFVPMWEKTNKQYGWVRSQVQPKLSGDAEAMLKMGKKLATFNKNVMVKIPGTKAGVWVLEELAALGIATTPTVCVSAPQILAVAEANERGIARAVKAGIAPAPSTCAFVMGRLQDYLASVNEQRGKPVSTGDLEWAVLAVLKRLSQTFEQKGYKQVIMPAAFRCAMQVSESVGGTFNMTIHPKIQEAVAEAEAAGKIKREKRIDAPVDQAAVDRVLKAIPEFRPAYEPDGLKPADFDAYGATGMTLDGFDKTGWQKLFAL